LVQWSVHNYDLKKDEMSFLLQFETYFT